MPRRRSPKRTVCSAPVGRFGSSNMDGRPMPQWLGADHLTSLWKRYSGGCHLNRQTDDLLRSVGFKLARLNTGCAQGPRPMTFMYEGQAEPQR